MTRVRIVLVAALASVAVAGLTISNAVAAPGANGSSNVQSVPPIYKLAVHGVGKNGKKFTGTYGIQRFVVATVHGKRGVYALGTLKGRLGGQHVSRNNVMLPAKLTAANGTMKTGNKSTRQAATTCTVLHLVLGPIKLNLLGLQVTLGGGTGANLPIVLDITANPSGGLLGQLLCSLTNSLSGSGLLSQLSSQLQALSATLTSLISLLP